MDYQFNFTSLTAVMEGQDMVSIQTPIPAATRVLNREAHHHSQRKFDFTMAFQPIIDAWKREVFAYEALVRGRHGESARSVLKQVNDSNRYDFDQACRIKALCQGKQLELTTGLAINFLPNALYQAETCLRATLLAARHYDFPVNQIIFELTEGERVVDIDHVGDVIRECQQKGLRIAIDDFGAGHSGLNLLADLHPDIIKLDMGLCRRIDESPARRAIVHGVMTVCQDMKIEVVAEGIESEGEYAALSDLGLRYFQGYLFARPLVESLPAVRWILLAA